jgi:hypothetical protein
MTMRMDMGRRRRDWWWRRCGTTRTKASRSRLLQQRYTHEEDDDDDNDAVTASPSPPPTIMSPRDTFYDGVPDIDLVFARDDDMLYKDVVRGTMGPLTFWGLRILRRGLSLRGPGDGIGHVVHGPV